MPWSDRIGRRVKLRDLHVLLAVAETRSMAKAAQRLAISQPHAGRIITGLMVRASAASCAAALI